MTAFVIGNGLSRKGIDLTKLDGMTYGCNWLYKEFKPDVLVATDTPISEYIQSTYYPKFNKFYTRKVYANTGALQLKKQFKNWASGPNALQLAVSKHSTIVMLGFDFGSTNNKVNNVYAGTQFYDDVNSESSYTGCWINQVNTVFRMNDSVRFKIVSGNETTNIIQDFIKYKNVEIISINKFNKEYIDISEHK